MLRYRIQAARDDPLKRAVNHKKCATPCLISKVVVLSLSDVSAKQKHWMSGVQMDQNEMLYVIVYVPNNLIECPCKCCDIPGVAVSLFLCLKFFFIKNIPNIPKTPFPFL